MSIVVPYRFLAVLTALCLGVAPAVAQKPASSTWTEPPIRGTAEPIPAKSEPQAESKASARRGAADEAPPRSTKTKARADTRPVRRSAKLGRADIRREAARSRRLALRDEREDLRAAPRRRASATASSGRQAVRTPAERSRYAYRYARRPLASPRYGFAEPNASVDPDRREAWGGLLGTVRERRIAAARARGYLVMQSQTYAYPDGSRVRMLTPIDPDDPD